MASKAVKSDLLQSIVTKSVENSFLMKCFFAVFIFIVSIAYVWRDKTKKIPKVGGIPFIGSLRKLSKQPPHKILTLLKKKHGDLFYISLGSQEAIVCCSLEGLNEALSMRGAVYADRPDTFTAGLLYGDNRSNGISMSDYDDKFRMKKKLLESCMFDKGDIFADAEEKIIQMVVKMCYEFEEQSGSAFNPRDVIACAVMNMTTLILFNEEYEYNDNAFIKLLYTMDIRFKCGYSQIGDFFPLLKFIPSEKAQLLYLTHNMLRDFTYKHINQHKDDYVPGEFRDVMDRIIRRMEMNEDNSVLKDADLIYIMSDLMAQSFEPVTATLEWTLLYMAANPEIQKKVQQEIDGCVGRERLPCLKDRSELPYTQATIYEIQRMATVMPLMFPHTTIAGTKLLGYEVPQFAHVLFNIWSIHHDARYWRKPFTFNPERFLDPQGNVIKPDAFLPYGMGRRSCLGKILADVQVFLFFAITMHQFFIQPVSGKDVNLAGEYTNFVVQPKNVEIVIVDNSRVRDKEAGVSFS